MRFGSQRFFSLRPGLLEIANLVIELFSAKCLFWVTGGKTPSEYIFSELPQVADIARSAFHRLARPSYCRSLRSGSERFQAELWPNNSTRSSLNAGIVNLDNGPHVRIGNVQSAHIAIGYNEEDDDFLARLKSF